MRSCVIATTDPSTLGAFLLPHVDELLQRGYQVTIMAGPGAFPDVSGRPNAEVRVLQYLRRNPSPAADTAALLCAWWVLRRNRTAIIHVGTPKAGLVIGLAAFLARVDRRVYTIHGLRYETATGRRGQLFRLLERVSCSAATDVIAVSDSVATQAVADGVVDASKVRVLGSGSISGVDVQRFTRDEAVRTVVRREWGVRPGEGVVLFVGRLSVDKGVDDLLAMWQEVRREVANVRLIVAGGLDTSQPPDEVTLRALSNDPQVVLLGHVNDSSVCYAGADLLVLPTKREGFGSVILEAACSGVPTVSTLVTGVKDAVVHGVTGVLVPPSAPQQLAHEVVTLLRDDRSRVALGAAARKRAAAEFAEADVVARYVDMMVADAL